MRNAELIHKDSDFDIPSVQALIQGAVQEAIEAWGWGWSVYCDTEGLYMGRCAYVDEDHEARFKYHESHESPAHALLSAYLEALEATKGICPDCGGLYYGYTKCPACNWAAPVGAQTEEDV